MTLISDISTLSDRLSSIEKTLGKLAANGKASSRTKGYRTKGYRPRNMTPELKTLVTNAWAHLTKDGDGCTITDIYKLVAASEGAKDRWPARCGEITETIKAVLLEQVLSIKVQFAHGKTPIGERVLHSDDDAGDDAGDDE